jgi:hypothetical protein
MMRVAMILILLSAVAVTSEIHAVNEGAETQMLAITQEQANEFLRVTNKYRCEHGAPPLTWSDALADNTNREFGSHSGGMPAHARSYNIPVGEGGPAGENIAWASNGQTPERAVDAWYNEVNNCGTMPGCKTGKTGVVGHFTAMIWKSATVMGCTFTADGNSAVCRYGTPQSRYSNDCSAPTAPNMGNPGCYEKNVLPKGSQAPAGCEGAGATPPAGNGGTEVGQAEHDEEEPAPAATQPPPPPPPAIQPPPESPLPATNCRDKTSQCPRFQSWCGKHCGVTRACPVTCGKCPGGAAPPPPCEDRLRNGVCERYQHFCGSHRGIQRLCKFTCELC